jgi:hypothetical protein
MLNLKAFALLTISVATLSSLSSLPASAGFLPGYGVKECEYIRRNINSRLPKGINLNRSVVTEVTVRGKTSRECVVYGNEVAIRYALDDYRTLPDSGVRLPNGTDTLYYGWKGSYVNAGKSAIIILTDSGTARD